MLPQQSIKHPCVDIIVRGEGEITICELAQHLQNNGDLSNIKGITYKKKGKIISTSDREFMDINEIDIELPYELLNMNSYYLEYFPIVTSRGCPHRCGFCYNLVFNKRRWRCKNSERVLNEIEYIIEKFNPKNLFFFSEDEFFIDLERVKNICKGIINRRFNIKWQSFCRFDRFSKIDDYTLRLIENSGCCSLSFGAESGSQRILDKIIRKDIKIKDILKTTKLLSQTNIIQIVSFMSALPTETESDLEKTFNLIKKLKIINPKIYINGILLYTPYAGTPLFELLIKKYNCSFPTSLEGWASYGIYRNVSVTWHSKKYIKMCKVISILTRFPFYREKFTLKDIGEVIAFSRFQKFPINIIYYIYANLAILRWKYKFFKFPFEFILLEKILVKIRGFV